MRAALAALLLAASLPAAAQQQQKADPAVARGRYVVAIAGCNDCHTPNYPQSGGKVPEKDWLTGDALGWRGPWGTTYAPNLRLSLPQTSEAEWVKKAKTLTTRPPMPWFNLHRMTEADLRAIYRYVRHLGPAGKPAPAYVPPDQTPAGPYVQFPG
jgi:mono/diheme cytochrome c family protein